MNVVSALFEELFNLRISSSTLSYTSCADTCKIQSSGSVTVSNLASSCLHNSEHDSTDVLRSTLVSDKGRGNTIISRVLWTGHILDGNPRSNSVDNNSWTVIITPYHVTYGDDYSNKQDHVVRREYRFTLMHELSHQLDAPDHYCYNDANEHVPCSNPSCWYHLGELQPDCIMFSRSGHDMEADPVETLYCQDCIDTISDHLEDHH